MIHGAFRRSVLSRRTAARRAQLLAIALAVLALAQPTAHATTYLEQTPEEMTLAADLIFIGTVTAVNVALESGTPWTSVTFDVEDLLLDRASTSGSDEESDEERRSEVTLRFLGGATAGGERLTVSGVPRYVEGQRELVFAYDEEGLASPIVGVRQGSWTLSVQGARDEDGDYLTVPAPGRLQRGAVGSAPSEVVESIEALLDAGTLPDEPPPGEADGEAEAPTGEAPADEADSEEEPTDEAPPADAPAEVPAVEEPPTEEPTTEEPATEEPPIDDPASQEPVTEEPPTDEPPVEEPPADEPTVGDPPTEATPPIVVRYRVDESGGPLLLSTAVNQAAEAWALAAPDAVEFVQQTGDADDANAALDGHVVRYGDAALFGPDALSLTLARGDANATEVLVSPTVGSLIGPVLLHELGVLLGLAEGGAGVMGFGAVPGVGAPTPADVAALRELRTFRAEDLNRDGVVDFYDLAAFGRSYGQSGVNLAADLNGDGQVDDADLALLEAAYQFLPPNEQPPGSPGL